MFLFRSTSEWGRRFDDAEAVLVVVDGRTEVDFWTGDRWRCGEVCPGSHFEVLA